MATTVKSKRKSDGQVKPSTAKIPLAAQSEKSGERPIWETVAELGSQISDADWEKVPDDSSTDYKN